MGVQQYFRRKKSQQANNAFISVWKTDNTSSGSSSSNQVRLPLRNGGSYNFTVNWGDGNSDLITAWNQSELTHTYASAGTYEVTISGVIRGWRFNNTGDRLKLLEIKSWGTFAPLSNSGTSNACFWGCSNMDITADDVLDLSDSTTLQLFFTGCSSLVFNDSINNWDVSGITILQNFAQQSSLNQPIGNWNVSACVNFTNMFFLNSQFNQDLSGWTLSSTSNINMSAFASQASAFQGLGLPSWNVARVTNFSQFARQSSFNQNISGWDVSNCTNFSLMFFSSPFNQPIGGWDMVSATNISQMLQATPFNQDISGWDVRNVTTANNFMLSNTAFNTTNYDAVLIAWSGLPLKSNVPAHFGSAKYSAGVATTARGVLTSTYNWTITDGGQV